MDRDFDASKDFVVLSEDLGPRSVNQTKAYANRNQNPPNSVDPQPYCLPHDQCECQTSSNYGLEHANGNFKSYHEHNQHRYQDSSLWSSSSSAFRETVSDPRGPVNQRHEYNIEGTNTYHPAGIAYKGSSGTALSLEAQQQELVNAYPAQPESLYQKDGNMNSTSSMSESAGLEAQPAKAWHLTSTNLPQRIPTTPVTMSGSLYANSSSTSSPVNYAPISGAASHGASKQSLVNNRAASIQSTSAALVNGPSTCSKVSSDNNGPMDSAPASATNAPGQDDQVTNFYTYEVGQGLIDTSQMQNRIHNDGDIIVNHHQLNRYRQTEEGCLDANVLKEGNGLQNSGPMKQLQRQQHPQHQQQVYTPNNPEVGANFMAYSPTPAYDHTSRANGCLDHSVQLIERNGAYYTNPQQGCQVGDHVGVFCYDKQLTDGNKFSFANMTNAFQHHSSSSPIKFAPSTPHSIHQTSASFSSSYSYDNQTNARSNNGNNKTNDNSGANNNWPNLGIETMSSSDNQFNKRPTEYEQNQTSQNYQPASYPHANADELQQHLSSTRPTIKWDYEASPNQAFGLHSLHQQQQQQQHLDGRDYNLPEGLNLSNPIENRLSSSYQNGFNQISQFPITH